MLDVVLLIAVLLLLALMMFGWKFEADDNGVSLKLLSRFVVAHIPYREIDKIERIGWQRAWWLNLSSLVGRRQWNWGGSLVGERVVIHRRDGTLFILAPRDPDLFLGDLERRRKLLQ